MNNDLISRAYLLDLAEKQNNLLDGGDVRSAPSVEPTMFGIPMDEAARVLGIYATTREIPSSKSYVEAFYDGVSAQAEEYENAVVSILENEYGVSLQMEVEEAQPYETD